MAVLCRYSCGGYTYVRANEVIQVNRPRGTIRRVDKESAKKRSTWTSDECHNSESHVSRFPIECRTFGIPTLLVSFSPFPPLSSLLPRSLSLSVTLFYKLIKYARSSVRRTHRCKRNLSGSRITFLKMSPLNHLSLQICCATR